MRATPKPLGHNEPGNLAKRIETGRWSRLRQGFRACSSVGGAAAFQAAGREFKTHHAL
jgi:hypothetical protein